MMPSTKDLSRPSVVADTAGQPGLGLHAASTETLAPVLAAIDLSEGSEAIVTWACDFAQAVGAPLEILHVIHDPAEAPSRYRPDANDLLEPIADIAKRRLVQFLADLRVARPQSEALQGAAPLCVEGLPVATILEVVRQRQPRLLVLGSRRRSALTQVLNGSVSRELARNAAVPVTIVKTPQSRLTA